MFEIQTPFSIKGIPLKPELSGRQKVDETLIQTLSALLGFDGEARRLLTCALNGSLNVVAPTCQEIVNIQATGDGQNWTFTDTPCTEAMVRNIWGSTADIFVQVGRTAAGNDGWRLRPGEWIKLSINNMNVLNIYFIDSGNRAEIARAV